MGSTPDSAANSPSRERPPPSPQGRNLIILCDGTGNELGGALSDEVSDIRISNVLKLFRIAQKGERQLVYYTPGVGTIGRVDWLYRWKQKFLSVIGLATGYGLDANILGAYRFIVENWREGDRIFLLGFSRGAWTVRVLAGLIHLIGLVRQSQLNLCDNALATYKRAALEDKMPIAWHFARVLGTRYPTIDFVGVWDTVASVLVPRADRAWIPSLETLPYTQTNPSVRIFRHALAVDERRRMFRVAKWVQPQPFVPNRFEPETAVDQDIEQRWFPGCHSDIGGGFRESESALSKRPLIWMVEEAVKAGLRITQRNFDKFARGQGLSAEDHHYVAPDATADLHNSLTLGWKPLEILPKSIKYREWERWSLLGFYLPLAEPRPIGTLHVVDVSISQRWHSLPSWRPINLKSAPPNPDALGATTFFIPEPDAS